MAELWPSASRRILPRSFKPQTLAVPHGSPFVRQPVQTPFARPVPPPKPTTTKSLSDPTVGASSNQPEDFFPLIPENQPQNHIVSFLKSLSATPLNENSLPSSKPSFITIDDDPFDKFEEIFLHEPQQPNPQQQTPLNNLKLLMKMLKLLKYQEMFSDDIQVTLMKNVICSQLMIFLPQSGETD